jgi:hypothetical protein
MDYSRFINEVAKRRMPSAIREISKHFSRVSVKYYNFYTASMLPHLPKTTISLAGGLPHGDAFPFVNASFGLRDGSTISFSNDEMQVALQYSATQG